MAGPRVTQPNLLAQGTILNSSTGAGTDEIAYPAENVFLRLNSKSWRSNYQSFTITANNNKLDFSVTSGGGTPLVATILLGDYRGEELATEISTRMNAAAPIGQKDIFCTYNRDNKSFIFSKTDGYLYLLFANGGNRNNSIAPTLQYACWANITAAAGSGGTVTSELDAKGTGGIYRIDNSNNTVYWNDGANRQCTIPSGAYSAKELAAEIKYQIELVSGGAPNTNTNFHVNIYPSLGYRWKIGRLSGTFNLRLSQTLSAIWDTLGYVTGADRSGTGPVLHLSDYTRIHGGSTSTTLEGEGIVIDMGAATTFRFFAIAGCNFQAAGTGGTLNIVVQFNTSDVWTGATETAPTATSYDRVNKKSWAYWDFGSDQTYRFIRVQIVNNDNPDGFVQIGALYGGLLFQLTKGWIMKTGTLTHAMFSETDYTDQGAPYGIVKADLKEVTFEHDNLKQADANFLHTLIGSVATLNPFGILLDSTGLAWPKFLWCHFVEIPDLKERTLGQGGGSIWVCQNFHIREMA